jgi:hypothetical protein
MAFQIHLKLKSDATFGRGDGVAGLVDQELEYDAKTGLPFLRGRTLKGLLAEECSNILFALNKQQSSAMATFEPAGQFLFGQAGSTMEDDAHMCVGAAMLPKELRQAIEADVSGDPPALRPAEILESLTAIRRQTALGESTGAPEQGSLRSMRVVLRHTPFVAELSFEQGIHDDARALLAACVLSLRRGGTGRNRGRGRLMARLHDEQGRDITDECFRRFRKLVEEGTS